MKKKTLLQGVLFTFLFCVMVLCFQTTARAEGNYYLKVNKTTNVVTVYTQDHKPYTAFVCSVGYATPLGTFYTPAKYTWWMLDGPSYGQYCTRITGSFLFHSVWYYQQDKTTQSYVQYNKLGTTASHGCVRLTTAAAKWIYDNCPIGTKVIIFNGSSSDDPLGKPSFIRVSTSVSTGWDPTDPDPNNTYSTKSTRPRIVVNGKPEVQYKGKFTPVSMTVYDSAGNVLSSAWIRTSGTVNTNQMGNYPVTYSVTDSFGRDASVTVNYKVGDAEKPVISGVKEEITKEYKSNLKLLKGVTGKNSLGNTLTKQIIVKVRKPGTETFKKVKNSVLTLNQVGKYKIMYYLKNPTNKLTDTKYMKVIVKDTKKPVISSEDNFAAIELKAGTTSISYKKLMSGISASLVSGKNMRSKVSIKITDMDGKTKTVAKNGSYHIPKAGTYTVVYYCTNTNKNLKTGVYKVAKKSRKMIVAEEVRVKEIVVEINAPENEVLTVTGAAVYVMDDVKAVTTTIMTDNTSKTTETTKNIQCSVSFRASETAEPSGITLNEEGAFLLEEAGIYTITYQYTDKKGNTAEYIRTITVTTEDIDIVQDPAGV